uniref:RING-type E3 ubiquitin transferase n=1 Tax=Kalanchoe fedtschenkoi TaxID=63787 RepID=A0A7N0VDY6_KALFE
MLKSSTHVKQEENDLLTRPIQAPPYSAKSSFEAQLVPSAAGPASSSSSSSNAGRISPIVLLMIIILAAIFFISGCLHLLFRYLMKRPPSRSLFHSNRYTSDQASTSHALQRQLQQLFRLHDSGLDQPAIDSLPIFYYKDVTGLKQQFECAVCLSEFSNQDKLRLLPVCSHAFHITCIDPWLLSNSTCPLCRCALVNPSLPSLTQTTTSSDDSTEVSTSMSNGFSVNSESSNSVTLDDSFSGEKRVYSIRLGKFRTLNDEADDSNGESSRLDGRRCYSMGSYQYVVSSDSCLRVALDLKLGKVKQDRDCVSTGEVESKKIGGIVRAGESFSMSKIWLWSKKSKFQDHHHQQDSSFGVGDAGLGLSGRLDIA